MPDLSNFFTSSTAHHSFAPAGTAGQLYETPVETVIIDRPSVDPTRDADHYNPHPVAPSGLLDFIKCLRLGA